MSQEMNTLLVINCTEELNVLENIQLEKHD